MRRAVSLAQPGACDDSVLVVYYHLTADSPASRDSMNSCSDMTHSLLFPALVSMRRDCPIAS
jgi:hypothetical protein